MSRIGAAFLFVCVVQWAQPQGATKLLNKSAQAVGYQVGTGKTKVDFQGTPEMPQAEGTAEVEAKPGYSSVTATLRELGPVTQFGAEFLTYVLWAISPDGRASNLGEIQLDKNGNGRITVSTQMQTFALVVTAEPYFAVRMPSELVVAENVIRKDTKGKQFVIDKCPLLTRARYQKLANPLALAVDLKSQPLDLYEARNAVGIAKMNGADKFAPEIYGKAVASLQMAENALKSKADRKQVVSTSKQAVQFSQDALTLALSRQEADRLALEKKTREDAERQAKENAEREAALRAQADAERAKAELHAAQAEAAKAKADAERMQAEAARVKAEAEQAQAQAAQRQADSQAQQALAAQREAERLRAQAVAEKAQLRAKLLQQFQTVLDTRDTDRGLVINMSDVLFDSGKFTLRPLAKEKLARIAGIVLNYPDLKIQAEGHTDNVGSAEFNQKLSEQRAGAVSQYLLSQGLPEAALTSIGKGFDIPVASNDTAAGRQQNRRVELIVSGEIIGTAVGDTRL